MLSKIRVFLCFALFLSVFTQNSLARAESMQMQWMMEVQQTQSAQHDCCDDMPDMPCCADQDCQQMGCHCSALQSGVMTELTHIVPLREPWQVTHIPFSLVLYEFPPKLRPPIQLS